MSRRDEQLRLMKEELKTYVWVSAEEMCANIDARFALILNAVTPPPLPQPLPLPDPKGKEEEVEVISLLSSDDEEYQEEPEKSKRTRKKTPRYSPSLQDGEDDDEGESIAEGGISRSDKAQWKIVSKLSPNERTENPWWQHRFGEPLAAVRDALGYQSKKNKNPRKVWDKIMEDPDDVTFNDLDSSLKIKCGLCGQIKTCSSTIALHSEGDEYYLGSKCVQLARNLYDFSLRHREPVTLEDMDEALGWVIEAHANKKRRRR